MVPHTKTASAGTQAALRTQYAALPYREESALEILLITSRETQRWVIPKGWPMESLQPWETAAREALEEAGVEGAISRKPLGAYLYEKRLPGGILVPCSVDVFPMRVERQRKEWREKDQRAQRWLSVPDAIEAVQEQELKSLLRTFAATPRPSPR